MNIIFNKYFGNKDTNKMNFTQDEQPNPKGYSDSYNGIYFFVNDDGLSVTVTSLDIDRFYIHNKYDINLDINIPFNYNGTNYSLPITNIGNQLGNPLFILTYEYNLVLKLPSTLKYLGDGAFRIPNNLAKCNLNNDFKLPEGLLSIGNASFMNVTINSIIIPASVNTIGYNAFYNSGLKNITFNSNILPNIYNNEGMSSFNGLIDCIGHFNETNVPTEGTPGYDKITNKWYELYVNYIPISILNQVTKSTVNQETTSTVNQLIPSTVNNKSISKVGQVSSLVFILLLVLIVSLIIILFLFIKKNSNHSFFRVSKYYP